MSSAPFTTMSPIGVIATAPSIKTPQGSRQMPRFKRAMRLRGGLVSSILSLPPPHNPESPAELKLLRALIDRCAGPSPPSRVDVEKGLENGLARLILLEGRLRAHLSRATGTRGGEEPCDDELSEEIRALREAVAELRARADSGEAAPLARGFIVPRKH